MAICSRLLDSSLGGKLSSQRKLLLGHHRWNVMVGSDSWLGLRKTLRFSSVRNPLIINNPKTPIFLTSDLAESINCVLRARSISIDK